MNKKHNTNSYTAYLLRLWRNGNQTEWRASLQQAGTQETHVFPSLFDAYVYLEAYCKQESQDEQSHVIH